MSAQVETQAPGPPTVAGEDGERIVMPSCSVGGESAPSRVLIAPWGEVASANGTFVMDDESARLVLDAYAAHGTDLPIDYEHQSLGGTYASPTGQAPAAGWIRGLKAIAPEQAGDGPAGLVAEVSWTDAARGKLIAREYRYLSPVVIVRRRDRRVVALHSAALTNKPAIPGMQPIVNREAEPGCGVACGQQGASHVSTESRTGESRTQDGCEAVEMLRMRLELGAEADTETILRIADERLASLMQQVLEREASDRVATAMRAGKLAHGQRDWATSLAMSDPAAFDAWLQTAPVLVATGRTHAPDVSGGAGRDRAAVIHAARAAFAAEPELSLLTNESAWIANALRDAGLEER